MDVIGLSEILPIVLMYSEFFVTNF